MRNGCPSIDLRFAVDRYGRRKRHEFQSKGLESLAATIIRSNRLARRASQQPDAYLAVGEHFRPRQQGSANVAGKLHERRALALATLFFDQRFLQQLDFLLVVAVDIVQQLPKVARDLAKAIFLPFIKRIQFGQQLLQPIAK
jgi:hypothetical protein